MVTEIQADQTIRKSATVNQIPWETVFYVVILIAAVATRFANLEVRVMSHDESLLSFFARNFYEGKGYENTPLLHGPLTILLAALNFSLFGVNDFTARIAPAAMGTIMVLMPKLLFQRWLGRYGAMIMSILILINPMLLYYSRMNREDTPQLFASMWVCYGIFAYLDGTHKRRSSKLILLAIALLFAFAASEFAFTHVLAFGCILTLCWVFQVMRDTRLGVITPTSWRLIVMGVVTLTAGATTIIARILLEPSETSVWTMRNLLSSTFLGSPTILLVTLLFVLMFHSRLSKLPLSSTYFDNRFKLIISGIIIGITGGLLATCIWSLFRFDSQPEKDLIDIISWLVPLVIVFLTIIIVPAIGKLRQHWRGLLLLIALSVIIAIAMLILDRSSRDFFGLFYQDDQYTIIDQSWLVVSCVVSVSFIIITVAVRVFTSFFKEMSRYAIFDVLIIIATFTLPWLSAIPLGFAGFDYIGRLYPPDVFQVSDLIVLLIGLCSVVLGLCWKPRLWLVAAISFYFLYTVLFTSIFTNPPGMWSGIPGLIGYWVEQGGTRRGSMPVYVYFFVQLPMYEYLDVFGAATAGLAGIVGFWRSGAPNPAHPDSTSDILTKDRLPFPLFCGFWAVSILAGLTIRGDKMPYLVINLSIPLIFVTAWYLGTVTQNLISSQQKSTKNA